MKTSLTLSAVLFALSLSPVAFANDAQEQTQSTAVTGAAPEASVTEAAPPAPAAPSFALSVLERLEFDVRQQLIGSLRESALLVLQIAAPALDEVASTAKVDITAR